MATPPGTPDDPRLKLLAAVVGRTHFFDAVRFLEQLHPEAPRIGARGPVPDERVQLRPSVSLAYPAGDLESLELERRLAILTTTFLGLCGSSSPLPSSYSERLAQTAGDPRGLRVRAFLDLFHHRLLSLAYRSMGKYTLTPGEDDDPLLVDLLSLAGLDRERSQGATASLGNARIHVAHSRPASGLEALLRRRLGFMVTVEQLAQRTVVVPPEQRTRLGLAWPPRRSERLRHNVLGSSFFVGARVRDRNRVAIVVNAETYARFASLSPGGAAWSTIKKTITEYVRTPVDPELRIEVGPRAAPEWVLGEEHRLGRNTWLGRPVGGRTSVRFGLK